MSKLQFRQVPRTQVPTNSRSNLGKYANFFSELMDLQPSMTAAIEVACKKDGYNMTRELRLLADKENLKLGWSRNQKHTEFYYWLERKSSVLRRSA